MKKNIFLLVSVFLMIGFLSSSAWGIATSGGNSLISPLQGELGSPITEYNQIEILIKNVVRWIYTIFFVVAVLFILIAAYNYLQGGTNPKAIETAKLQLRYAVIAIAIALVASGVALVVNTFLGAASN